MIPVCHSSWRILFSFPKLKWTCTPGEKDPHPTELRPKKTSHRQDPMPVFRATFIEQHTQGSGPKTGYSPVSKNQEPDGNCEDVISAVFRCVLSGVDKVSRTYSDIKITFDIIYNYTTHTVYAVYIPKLWVKLFHFILLVSEFHSFQASCGSFSQSQPILNFSRPSWIPWHIGAGVANPTWCCKSSKSWPRAPRVPAERQRILRWKRTIDQRFDEKGHDPK